MEAKKEIMKTIETISGKYSAYEVFTDWIRCSALAISNGCQVFHNKVWQDREQMFIDTMRKYSKEEQNLITHMFVMLGDALEENMEDVLGDIYMKMGMGSKAAGQFFTPFHLSYLTAKLAIDNQLSQIKENDIIELNEPSCGGGGMIIAAAKVLKEYEFDFQKRLKVVAQDLDWKGVYMTYLQLSLLGIKAVVVQGDTICDPYTDHYPEERKLYTPAERGALV